MSYRCPLCLKLLDASEKLERRCTTHPDRNKTFNCGHSNMPRQIFCPASGCRCADEISNGVFLRHVGCAEHNPFWDGSKIDLDGQSHESWAAFLIDFGAGDISVQVQHWLIGVLRNFPRDVREMWFPLMLLRATAERNGSRRIGRLVELSGARSAGKTILAVQAMNPHGYAPTPGLGSVLINNFIFSRRVGERTERHFRSFIETLHLSTLLRRSDKNIFLPEGTPHGARNLRVAFIKPAVWSPAPSDGTWKGLLMRIGRMLWHDGKRILRDDVTGGISDIFGGQGVRPYWHAIVFYDKSGEVDENEDVITDILDKVAVVVNAAEILGLAEEEENAEDVLDLFEVKPNTGNVLDLPKAKPALEKSLEVAVQRIIKAIESKQLCYLVVTQLDKVKKRIGADWQQVQRIADDLTDIGKDRGPLSRAWSKLSPRRSSPAHQLLEKWLGDEQVGNRRQLKDHLKDVEEIFFIWTDDLPTPGVPALREKLPSSHGLAKFVCRCLEIEWEQINQSSNS